MCALTLRSKPERIGDESLFHPRISFVHGYIWWPRIDDIATWRIAIGGRPLLKAPPLTIETPERYFAATMRGTYRLMPRLCSHPRLGAEPWSWRLRC